MFEINIKLTTFKSTFFLKKIINSGIYVQTPSGEPISKLILLLLMKLFQTKYFVSKVVVFDHFFIQWIVDKTIIKDACS